MGHHWGYVEFRKKPKETAILPTCYMITTHFSVVYNGSPVTFNGFLAIYNPKIIIVFSKLAKAFEHFFFFNTSNRYYFLWFCSLFKNKSSISSAVTSILSKLTSCHPYLADLRLKHIQMIYDRKKCVHNFLQTSLNLLGFTSVYNAAIFLHYAIFPKITQLHIYIFICLQWL